MIPILTLAGIDLPGEVARLERSLIAQALALADGNRARAARLLGIKRTTLVEKLRRDARVTRQGVAA